MMSAGPADPQFREGDEVVLAQGSYQGTLGVCSTQGRRQLGGHYGAQRQRPQSPGGMAGPFRRRDPGLRELTPEWSLTAS